MRILQVGKYYPPSVGGMETHVALLARGLLARGNQVEVLVHGIGTRTVREALDGVPVTRVGSVGRLLSTELSPGLIRELERPYDLLHLHTPHPMAMAAYLCAKKPPHTLVVTHHSDIIRQRLLKHILEPLFRAVLSRADLLITSSSRYADSSQELRPHRDKVRVVPFGIDLGRFAPVLKESSGAREISGRYGERLILSTGRLIYYKGFDVLLDAMRTVRGHLLIIGDGPLREQLERRARKNCVVDRVSFLGNVPDFEIGRYYRAARVFAFPSTARSEAFGIAQLEALAFSVPVVNTALESGVPEVSLHEITGLTVPPGDPGALATALNRLLDDPAMAVRLGANGRRRAEELFTAERMVERILSVYDEARTVRASREAVLADPGTSATSGRLLR